MVKIGYKIFVPSNKEFIVDPQNQSLNDFLEKFSNKSFSVDPFTGIIPENAVKACGLSLTKKEEEEVTQDLIKNNILFKVGHLINNANLNTKLLLKERD